MPLEINTNTTIFWR